MDRWTHGQAPVDGAGNIYAYLVAAFSAVLPALTPAQIADATEAGRLLARSVVRADRVIDHDGAADERVEDVLAAQVCQLEGILILQRLVPPGHPFWSELSRRLREFANACLAEATRETIDVAKAERIARDKNAMARLTAPLLSALGERPDLAAPFDAAIEQLIVAVQALDDAVDWRDDLAANRISLITARIWAELGLHAEAAAITRHVHGTTMPAVLRSGRAALAAAACTPALAGSQIWAQLTSKIAARYDDALAMFR